MLGIIVKKFAGMSAAKFDALIGTRFCITSARFVWTSPVHATSAATIRGGRNTVGGYTLLRGLLGSLEVFSDETVSALVHAHADALGIDLTPDTEIGKANAAYIGHLAYLAANPPSHKYRF